MNRKINYFELFGMEADFWCDTRIIEQNYRRLQRERHPDETGGSGIEETISINEAYDTLIDPIKRAEHVIQINGVDTNAVPTSVRVFAMLENAEENLKSCSYNMHKYLEEEDFEKAYVEWYHCNVLKRFLDMKEKRKSVKDSSS